MNWTREKPTVPGVYYATLSNVTDPYVYVAEVRSIDDEYLSGELCGNTAELSEVIAWCGPFPSAPPFPGAGGP